ncbi:diacylglycerol/lipid kinase family protein [Thalassobacillus devorans]|uniref:diacylglycerol/lipid kinase family protein n=1 Tax=Thalassobacillus devorans TaxID=279813 RepID=UPI0004BB1953|nr:diacylglycerol kinase family protein [Thalassobacillus devorans]
MHIVIVNAIAGNGRASCILEKIQREHSFQTNQCRSFITNYKGHAEEITKQVSEIYHETIKSVIVIGGDGTLHEVVNGLKHYPGIPLAFIPAGSGNDFARGAGIHMDPVDLFKRILDRPRVLSFKTGTYVFRNDDKGRRHFMNSIGFGLDAEVAYKADNSSLKKTFNKMRIGFMSYIIAFFTVLPTYKTLDITLSIDGKVKHVKDAYMVTVSRHPYYGGGMKIAPKARLDKDFYSVIVVESLPKWKIFLLFITVFFGKHTSLREVKQYKGRTITVESQSTIPVQIDGEVCSCRFCSIEIPEQKRRVYLG